MLPSLSLAVEVTMIFVGVTYWVPLAGLVRLTVGGALTVTLIVFDVVVAPELSVANADSV